MSESYITTGATGPLRTETIERAPQAGTRFTPLRSTIVVRDRATRPDDGETLSPLVPVRRRNT